MLNNVLGAVFIDETKANSGSSTISKSDMSTADAFQVDRVKEAITASRINIILRFLLINSFVSVVAGKKCHQISDCHGKF